MMRSKSFLLAAELSLLLAPAVAAAQQAPAASGEVRIGEIVVTAQRREERLQDVPVSVTALNADQLVNSGIVSTQTLATVTPTLTLNQSAGRALPTLRGVGTNFGAAGLENSVATYIDGVYLASPNASVFSLAGIERVEVLKGPQGTLFGRNATGGLIQVVTKKPSETFEGMLSGSYGNYETAGLDAYITGGIAPGLAMNFAAHASFQGEGYGRNLFLNKETNKVEHDLAFRSQLMYRGESTTVRLSADFSETEGSPYEHIRSPYDLSVFGPNLVSDRPWDSNADVAYKVRNRSYGGSIHVDHELSFADLVSITAYRKGSYFIAVDADNTPTDAFSVDFDQNDRQFSQEIQLVSRPDSAVTWLVGGYYFDATSRYEPVDLNFGPPLQDPAFPLAVVRTVNEQATRSYAAFGQATFALTEVTRLTAGLRYTTETKRYEGVQTGILASGAVAPLGQRLPDETRSEKVTWRFAVDHHFTPDIMAFASVNRGFKSGGYNSNAEINSEAFAPEQLDAYEVGLKADIFDHRVRLNPSIFYYNYTNLQVTQFTSQSLPVFVNGPSAELYGLDMDFVVQPTAHLTIRGALTVIHNEFGDFPGALFMTPNPPPTPGSVQRPGNAKGNRLPFTADWAATIAADYVIPVGFGEITLSGTYNHSDGYFTEVDNIRRQKAYDILNGSIRIEREDGGLFATLWGKNLTDEIVALQIIGGVANGGAAAYQPPRTYGVTVGARF